MSAYLTLCITPTTAGLQANTYDTEAHMSSTNDTEVDPATTITRSEWIATRTTELFGLKKEPKAAPRKTPGYASTLVREDVFTALKELQKTAPARVGMKEITTGLLAAALADEAITQAGMDQAKAVAIAALEQEIATLQQQP